ncbi:hypothetical protein PtB15_8B503 [Puccinia triticina]|nr:hypothetical protein PtB15_8B503 [Puccinia triticina]
MADPVQDGTNFYPVAGCWSPAYADQDRIVLPPPGLPSPVYCGTEPANEASSSDSPPVVTPPSSNTSVWPAPPSSPATISHHQRARLFCFPSYCS